MWQWNVKIARQLCGHWMFWRMSIWHSSNTSKDDQAISMKTFPFNVYLTAFQHLRWWGNQHEDLSIIWFHENISHTYISMILIQITAESSLTFLALKSEHSRIIMSIPWLLMPWLIASPGHQQLWYWICRMKWFLSSTRKDFNYLHHLSEKW